VKDTKWNTMAVLSGAGPTATAKGTFLIQVGADSGMTIGVTLGSMSTKASETLTALNAQVITSQATAAYSVSKIDTAFNSLNTKRATVGAFMNRLQGALDNALSMSQELTATRSNSLDTDYAATLAELARLQIIQQAGNAMLAQANAQPQSVLALLQ
jgi:flagellin